MDVGIISPWMLTRKAFCSLLGADRDFCVVLETDDALRNFELVRQFKPAVLLIEIIDPVGDLETVTKIRKLLPEIRMLLVSEASEDEFELRAIRAGAWGCVSKHSDPQVLQKALKAVGQGEIWVSHHMATLLIRKSLQRNDLAGEMPEELTQREWEILALVSGGYQNKEIASRLLVSANTIKAHLSAIYRKLQVRTRLAAALHYFQQAKLQPDRPAGLVASNTLTPDQPFAPSPDVKLRRKQAK